MNQNSRSWHYLLTNRPYREFSWPIISALAVAIVIFTLQSFVEGENAHGFLDSVALVILLSLVLVSISGATQYSEETYKGIHSKVATLLQKIDTAITQRASIVPYQEAYEKLMAALKNAERQVLLITHFTYDWEGEYRNWDDERMTSKERIKLFELFYDIINDDEIEYVRIFQRPEDREEEFWKAIKADPLYEREVNLLVKQQEDAPHKARLIVTGLFTEISFILIDNKSLFLNIDIKNPDTGDYTTPFVFFAEDLSDIAVFDNLIELAARMTSQKTTPPWTG